MGLHGGIEGGATKTVIQLFDSDGNVVAEAVGEATNLWLIGMEVAVDRLHNLVVEAKKAADINEPLLSLGMTLSGAEQKQANADLLGLFSTKYKGDSAHYFLRTDTYGGIYSACPNGGAILIAGTGSNCVLLKPDGSMTTCGGWGHMMGDEGGAYDIAHTALKRVFDQKDNLLQDGREEDTTYIEEAMKAHFDVENCKDMLDHLYKNFDKTFYASFAVKVSKGVADGDAACAAVFKEVAIRLAAHVVAIDRDVPVELSTSLRILCEGSVWKSWDIIKPAFIAYLRDRCVNIKKFELVRLTVSAALGAAYLGAKDAGYAFNIDYTKTTQVLAEVDLTSGDN